MKKFIGTICAGLAGVLTFVWFCLSWFAVKMTALGVDTEPIKATGYQSIADKCSAMGETAEGFFSETFEGAYVAYRIIAIIALVAAALLVVMSVIMLLKNLNVIKCKFNFSLINNILLSVLAVASIALLVILFLMGAGIIKEMGPMPAGYDVSAVPQIGAWLTTVIAVVACGCGWALARKDK